MRSTNRDRETGHVSPNDLVSAQRIEALEVGAQIVDSESAGGPIIFRRPDLDFDPLAQRLVDPEAVQQIDTGFRVTTYTLQQGWWQRLDPGEVESQLAKLPDALVEHVHGEVVDFLREADRRWRGALAANRGRDGAEGDPDSDRAVAHARSVLQVVDTERNRR
jgi:hypothetical protein